jgi:hypothetical protein
MLEIANGGDPFAAIGISSYNDRVILRAALTMLQGRDLRVQAVARRSLTRLQRTYPNLNVEELKTPNLGRSSRQADDPVQGARSTSGTRTNNRLPLESDEKMRVIPAFHRSSFEVGIACDFCFVGRRLSICLICAGVLPRTS